MFYQSSLLVMLLMPVIAYLAVAVAFSMFQALFKKPTMVCYQNANHYQNGL